MQGTVLGDLRVEEVEGHAADIDPPHVSGDLTVPDRDVDSKWRTFPVADAHSGQHLGIDLGPVLALPSGPVDALVEEAPPIQKAHADEGQSPVRRLLQQVAGKHPEPSGVHRQGPVHAELGTQERDGPVTEVGPSRAVQVGIEHLGNRIDTSEVLLVCRRFEQRMLGQITEEADRVLVAQLEAVRAEIAEQPAAVGCPRPAVVVRDPGQREQGPGHPACEVLDGSSQVVRAVETGILTAERIHQGVNLVVRRRRLTFGAVRRPLDRCRLRQSCECVQCGGRLL